MFTEKAIKDFWDRVQVLGPDDCWVWNGVRNSKGYGRHRFNGRSMAASRFSLIVERGDIGKLLACHSCDNPPCCNPAHLFAATNKQNMADAKEKGRKLGPNIGSPDICVKGHRLSVTGWYPNRKGRRCAECRRETALARYHLLKP